MQHLHSLHVEKELLEQQLDGVKEALTEKKKLSNKQKVLPLYAHRLDWDGSAKWWSPSSKREADAHERAYEAYAAEQEAAKATTHQLKRTQELLKDRHDEQACVRHARGKKERDKRRAEEGKAIDECKAEKACKKQRARLSKSYTKAYNRQAQGFTSCRTSYKAFLWS